jgi:hypothetical protein
MHLHAAQFSKAKARCKSLMAGRMQVKGVSIYSSKAKVAEALGLAPVAHTYFVEQLRLRFLDLANAVYGGAQCRILCMALKFHACCASP